MNNPRKENEVLLKVDNFSLDLVTENGNLPVIQDISFQIHQGEFLALVGESGCGKSVCSLALTKLLPSNLAKYKSGSILFQEEDIIQMDASEIQNLRGNKISYVFQEPFSSLNPLKKIKDQIIESFLIHKMGTKEEAIHKAEILLEKVGITDISQRLNSYPNHMSGGMLQRISIAMALITDPILLIADEPTSAIDVTIQAQLIQLLMEMKKQFSLSVLFISHDIALVSHMADRIAVMYAGQIVEIGKIDEVIDSPKHPYTQALLNSYPSSDDINKELEVIPGIVPSPLEYPIGCHFAERCKHKMDVCISRKPKSRHITETHSALCHLLEAGLT
ncbi:MAG: ABC transporter ATP-binding protein [Leptospiraceae bacterium]|jgi:peptide/nickel transport system ATP-binding protein|nr:ABC transporter ATP-binding protein [Leptospiraceae bacterium]MCZ8345923.1 ABC transporter ATP-binding protein [Leptospiraceae bacterium]